MGGTGVKAPEKTSFGTQVINQSVEYELDGSVEVDFRDEGVSYVVIIPGSAIIPASAALLEPAI
jgi:two-component system CheB/CheR fusion protein